MESQRDCPSGYQYYACASPAYKGCCSVDACSALGCPPGSSYSFGSSTAPPITPPSVTPRPTGAAQPTLTHTSILSIYTSTDVPPVLKATGASPTSKTAGASTQQSTTAPPTQQSAAASPTQSNTPSSPSSSPLLLIVAISIGGVLAIVIITLAVILCRRRRRKRKNSAGGLPTHDGVLEPFPNGGPVTAEHASFLALFKRTRSILAAKTATVMTSPPSTAPLELPSPSFPSEHNSLIPGRAELASPPLSSVSELSSADRGVYSSTNVSTASTGAVVSPHETLRGGGRPAMMPNMVSGGRERRKHALSWQSLEPGDAS